MLDYTASTNALEEFAIACTFNTARRHLYQLFRYLLVSSNLLKIGQVLAGNDKHFLHIIWSQRNLARH